MDFGWVDGQLHAARPSAARSAIGIMAMHSTTVSLGIQAKMEHSHVLARLLLLLVSWKDDINFTGL